MSFAGPDAGERARWLARLDEPGAHHDVASSLDCLRTCDVVAAPSSGQDATGWLRVAAWNLERGRLPDEMASLLAATGAVVCLVSEADAGMARTHNRDVTRVIGTRLGFGSAFGVEFVELGLGDEREAAACEGRTNEHGLHGNAVLSRYELRAPEVVRLDDGGDWFTAARGQPRVGGRMAVTAAMRLAGTEVSVASVHLESHSDAEHRARQMALLLNAIDARGAGPSIVAGDLNTFGAPLAELADRERVRTMRAAEPWRFSWPVHHEPLFEVAAAHGYEWVDANLAAPTTRHGPDGVPDHPAIKLDWILVRGLEARRPTVVATAGPDGRALSDHEIVAVSVRARP